MNCANYGVYLGSFGGRNTYLRLMNNIIMHNGMTEHPCCRSVSCNQRHGDLWIREDAAGSMTNYRIRNNIMGVDTTEPIAPYRAYCNGTRRSVAWLETPGNWTYGDSVSGNVTIDPEVQSDYTVMAGSSAVNAGMEVGLTEDYWGNPIVGLPDIGASEYQGAGSSTTKRLPGRIK